MKRIEIDGKFYRMRRGKLVEIPVKWLGNITTAKTIRQRKLAAKAYKRTRGVLKAKNAFCGCPVD